MANLGSVLLLSAVCTIVQAWNELVPQLVPAFLRHVSRSTPPETLSDLSLELVLLSCIVPDDLMGPSNFLSIVGLVVHF